MPSVTELGQAGQITPAAELLPYLLPLQDEALYLVAKFLLQTRLQGAVLLLLKLLVPVLPPGVTEFDRLTRYSHR